MSVVTGIVRCMLVRPAKREPVIELFEGTAREGLGFDGDDRAKGKRGLTLLAAEKWFDVIEELGTVLPWHTRRANLLVERIDLAETMGKRIRIGQVEMRIWAETKPCARMDELHRGLRKALGSDVRGGVYGEVLNDGIIRVGDPVGIVGQG